MAGRQIQRRRQEVGRESQVAQDRVDVVAILAQRVTLCELRCILISSDSEHEVTEKVLAHIAMNLDDRLAAAEKAASAASSSLQALRHEAQALTAENKARQRKFKTLETRALNVAFAVFCRTCPNATPPMECLVEHYLEVVKTIGLSVLQERLERAYLAASVEKINKSLSSKWTNGRSVEDEAKRFLLHWGMLKWITQQNEVQGVAPSFRMLCRQRDDLREQHADGHESKEFSLKVEARRKWCQRFRKEHGLAMSSIAARTVLPPDVLAAKASAMCRATKK